MGVVYYKKEEGEFEDIMGKKAVEIDNFSLISLFLLLIYVFGIV